MPPTVAIAIIEGVEQLIAQAPSLAAELQSLFSAGLPTQAQLDALKAKIQSESYSEFVPNSDLPASEQQ